MNALDLLCDLSHRPLDALDWFWEDLQPTRLNAHPGGHPNSPAWLLWHAAREIEVQVAHLAGTRYEQAWSADGFAERFGLDLDVDDLGYGHTPEQARSVTVPETEDGKGLLREHLEAVTRRAQGYLDTLTEADLDEVIDHSWDPPVTRGVRLISVFDDALQHVGQAGYVAGMTDLP